MRRGRESQFDFLSVTAFWAEAIHYFRYRKARATAAVKKP